MALRSIKKAGKGGGRRIKILAINGSHRRNGTTTRLTRAALAGAAAVGAATEMIRLVDKDIRFCANCLACYGDLNARIAPCVLNDDLNAILKKIAAADGVLFTSPVHCGFVSARMTNFIHRTAWTLLRPTGEILGVKGCPEPRLTDKTRPVATIVSAGGVPPEMRKYCDTGTPWLKDMAAAICNGECIGDMYAAAEFRRAPKGDEWSRMYHLRELTRAQLKQAYDLGATVARAARSKKVRPYDPAGLIASMSQA